MQNYLKQSEPHDPFYSTDLAGSGCYVYCTPNTGRNTDFPFWVDISQAPNVANYGGTNNYQYMYSYGWRYHYYTSGQYGNVYSLNTSLGNGWVYNYAYNYIAPPSSNFHGLLAYRLYISNTGWTGYYNSTPNMYFYNGSYLYGSGSQTRGNSYFVNFLIPVSYTHLTLPTK